MQQPLGHQVKLIGAGMLFALLWGSASTVAKIGLDHAQPLVIAVSRFLMAGLLMVLLSHVLLKHRLPQKKEWRQLVTYGLLNISVFMGMYYVALQYVAAGLATLTLSTSPIFISLLTSLWLQKPLKIRVIYSLLLCTAGVAIAGYPLLRNSYVSPGGLLILLLAILSYSAGSVYFALNKWKDLTLLTINSWQTLFGGLFLIPALLVLYEPAKNNWNVYSVGSIIWLSLMVSIVAVRLWLFLLSDHPIRGSFWLFLCPVVGFSFASVLLQEPISMYTLAGLSLVITGVYLIQKHQNKLLKA
jgi:probable blue pigment (indigoidine) exporter